MHLIPAVSYFVGLIVALTVLYTPMSHNTYYVNDSTYSTDIPTVTAVLGVWFPSRLSGIRQSEGVGLAGCSCADRVIHSSVNGSHYVGNPSDRSRGGLRPFRGGASDMVWSPPLCEESIRLFDI